jgi:N-acetylgalactosamine-N,N'-diacetylbacillosaminyl-diphospho-undecaprenol 4-alpha-N-acetylgalactosaminyltransferase
MRISVLIYSLDGGGAERVVAQFVSFLHEKGIDVCLVIMNDVIVYDIPKSVPIYYLEKSNPKESGFFKFFKLPFLGLKYKSFLKKEKIGISVSFLSRPNYINLMSKWFGSGVQTFVSERSNPSAQYSGSSFHSKINSFLIHKLFVKADGIIANSTGNGIELIHNFGIPQNLITTIHNPIDLEAVQNTLAVKDFYDANYFNFISVGRLNEGKNHELLIRSLAQVANTKIRLYIFGDGPLQEFLRHLIVNLKLENQVFLKGFSKDIFSYLKGADAFLFGSNHEGFPNVLIEAMASGLPIISTNCPSGPSEIMKVSSSEQLLKRVGTEYGILVPVGNNIEMAEAIDEIVNNKDYYSLCKKNVLMRSQDFRKEHILDQFLDYITKGYSNP